jgi:hypothetical protein
MAITKDNKLQLTECFSSTSCEINTVYSPVLMRLGYFLLTKSTACAVQIQVLRKETEPVNHDQLN